MYATMFTLKSLLLERKLNGLRVKLSEMNQIGFEAPLNHAMIMVTTWALRDWLGQLPIKYMGCKAFLIDFRTLIIKCDVVVFYCQDTFYII